MRNRPTSIMTSALVLVAGSVALCPAKAGNPAPAGVISGIMNGKAVTYTLATKAVHNLPSGADPVAVALSPKGRSAIYIVTVHAKDRDGIESIYHQGFISIAPFTTNRRLPEPVDGSDTADVAWVDDDHAYVASRNDLTGLIDVKSDRYTSSSTPVESVAPDSDWIAYSTASEEHVRNRRTGADVRLFSIGRPQSLLAALAKGGPGVKELESEVAPNLYSNMWNWAISKPAITPDGRTVYFLTNAGTTEGAQGNTTMCVVRADLPSRKLTVLGSLGLVFGRVPDVFSLSPDGRKLLIATSVHNSAADNSYVVTTVDIMTGRTVDLLAADGKSKKMANVVEGACWSPDSRYVAVAVQYYDPQALDPDADFVPDTSLEIKSASTGSTVRTIEHFSQPQWSTGSE